MSAKVSFRLRHSAMNLEPLTRALGLPVGRIWTSGDNRRTPKDEPLEGIYPNSYCAMNVVTAEGTIPAAIAVVAAALRAAVDSYPILKSAGLEKSLYCTLVGQGEILDCKSMASLVEWQIQLEIDN